MKIKMTIKPGSNFHEQFKEFWENKKERQKKLQKKVEDAKKQSVPNPN